MLCLAGGWGVIGALFVTTALKLHQRLPDNLVARQPVMIVILPGSLPAGFVDCLDLVILIIFGVRVGLVQSRDRLTDKVDRTGIAFDEDRPFAGDPSSVAGWWGPGR